MNVLTWSEFLDESREGETRMAEFERDFRYPLGPSAWFRISHTPRYRAFYESIAGPRGESECFVAAREGRVLGALSVATKTLQDPASRSQQALYFGDFKTLPSRGRGRVAWGLLRRAAQWGQARASRGLGVVMEGTARLPDVYTGRLGVPLFELAGRIALLRIAAVRGLAEARQFAGGSRLVDDATCADVRNARRELTVGAWRCEAGSPELRSETPAFPLLLSNRQACGWLEDTRRAKRLVLDDERELVSGHLSEFAFRDARDGALLVAHALKACCWRELPALFVAAPERRVAELVEALQLLAAPHSLSIDRANALIFGHDLPVDGDWWLSTAEI